MDFVKNTGILVLPIGAVFVFSGLVVNVLQLIAYLILWRFDRQLFRKFNQQIVTLNWYLFICVAQRWANIEIKLYGDFDTVGKHRGLLILNHSSDIDWLLGWLIADRFSILGGTKAFMKDVAKYLPVLGWCWWFCEFIWLKRAWKTDKENMYSGFESLSDYPLPYWLVLFPEGTRYTPKKHQASQQYALSNNLPHFDHLLLPRTKGFIAAKKNMENCTESLYDATICFKDGKVPSVLGLLYGEHIEAHVDCTRFIPTDIPNKEPELKKWLMDRWIKKDALIKYFTEHNQFPKEHAEYKPHDAKKKSGPALAVTLFWSFLLLRFTIKFLKWCFRESHFFILGSVVVGISGVLAVTVKFSSADKSKANLIKNTAATKKTI